MQSLSLFFSLLAGHAIFKLIYLNNHDYKALYFECDAATVNEIVLKVKSYTTVFAWCSLAFFIYTYYKS